MTGKGGVGKSAVAAAIALGAARRGKRTLLISMDGKQVVCPHADNLTTAVYDTEEALREYIRIYVKVPLVARLGLLAQTLDFVADAAPGVKEILAIGKVCYEVKANHFDLVVVDAESSGHIVGQLSTPATIRSLAQFGMIREQTSWMVDMLTDPVTTAAIIVATPEESPVDETIELADAIVVRAHVSVPLVVVNGMPAHVPESVADTVPLVISSVRRRHALAFEQLRRLSAAVPNVDIVSLPRLRVDDAVAGGSTAVDLVAGVAAALADELGDML